MSIIAAAALPHPPLIMPEVGRGDEKIIQRTVDAYRTVMQRAAALRPDVIVITSPHSVMYADYFHISPGNTATGSFAQFNAPQVSVTVDYDTEFVSALAAKCAERHIPAGTFGERNAALDHATLIPLRFWQEHNQPCPVVRIGLSGLPAGAHYALGQAIADVAEALGRRVFFVASGDLSHKLNATGPYGFAPEGPQFDRQTMDCLGRADFLPLLEMDKDFAERAAECGLRSFWIMTGALDGKNVKAETLSYEGPFGVGYGSVWFTPGDANPERDFGAQLSVRHNKRLAERKAREDALVRLARLSLETFVTSGHEGSLPDNLPAELTDVQAGAFVSLKKDGNLRGCIGTILPTQKNLAAEIWHNAISAAARDPRFSPVRPDELAELVYSVDVLTQPEEISSPQELDPARYGVIVQNGGRQGLLLPDLAGVDTVDKQISIAKQKAGIGAKEPVKLWRFEAIRHY